MRLLRDASIKRKLYAIIMGTTTAVLLLSLALSLVLQLGAARDAASSHLHALAAVLPANSRATVAFRDSDEATQVYSPRSPPRAMSCRPRFSCLTVTSSPAINPLADVPTAKR